MVIVLRLLEASIWKKLLKVQSATILIRPEEKKTDVNISIRMVADCVQDKTDTIILVSGDNDLVSPIEFIQKNYPHK